MMVHQGLVVQNNNFLIVVLFFFLFHPCLLRGVYTVTLAILLLAPTIYLFFSSCVLHGASFYSCRYLLTSCLLHLCTYCTSHRILARPHCLAYNAPVIAVIPEVIVSPHFMARARIPSATALRELPKACLELWRALFTSLSKYGAPQSSELLAFQPCHPLPYESTYPIH